MERALLVLPLLLQLLVWVGMSRAAASHRKLQEFENGGAAGDGIKVEVGGWRRMELVHRDLSIGSKSMGERMALAVERSRRRLNYFQTSIIQQQQQRRLRDDDNEYEAPVSSDDGAYLTSLTIGTPGVSFSAIADTGSDLVWRQCQPCIHCYNQTDTQIFDPSHSSTYKPASCDDPLCQALPQPQCSSDSSTCQYMYKYGDQSSTSGDLAYDTLTLQHYSSNSTAAAAIPHFGFGCAHDSEGGDFGGAGGLVGLGQGPLSLPSQISAKALSYCLVSMDDSSSQTSPMFIGNSTPPLPNHASQSTPIITSPLVPTFYYIRLNDISVGSQLLHIPTGTFDLQPDGSGGMIIDSGTTLTYLADAAYQPLFTAFKSAIHLPPADGSHLPLDLCYAHSGSVPSLTFHFDGADMQLPTQNYFVELDGLFCLAIASSSSLGISIFGNIHQQNFHFLYDRTTQQLSFAPATCDKL